MNSKTLGPVLTHTGTINMTHVIPSVTNVNQGLYSCSATNVGGTGTASTQLRAKGRECCCNIIAEAPLLRHCYFEIKIFGATQCATHFTVVLGYSACTIEQKTIPGFSFAKVTTAVATIHISDL